MSEFFVKAKIVFDRGKYWVSYLMFLMMVFVTVTSMKEYELFRFLESRYWLVIVLLGSVVFMGLLGYIELTRFRTYQKEAEVLARLNPVQARMLKNQEDILAGIRRIEKKLK